MYAISACAGMTGQVDLTVSRYQKGSAVVFFRLWLQTLISMNSDR
jgi:hypothetical protein